MIDFEDFEKISYTSDDGNTMEVFRDSSEDLIVGFIREVDGGFKARVLNRDLFGYDREVEFQKYNFALKYILKTCRVIFPEGFDEEGDSAF